MVPLIVVAIVSVLVSIYVETRTQLVAQFYQRNLLKYHTSSLAQSVVVLEAYIQHSRAMVEEFASDPVLDAVYGTDDSSLALVGAAISRLTLALPETAYIRLFDATFSRLAFSNNPSDIAQRVANQVQLKTITQLDDVDTHIAQLRVLREDEGFASAVLFNAADHTIVYYFCPATSLSDSTERCVAVYSLFTEAENLLSQSQLLGDQERLLVIGDTLLLNALRSIDYENLAASELTNNTQIIFDEQFAYTNLQLTGTFGVYNYFVSTSSIRLPRLLALLVYSILIITLLLFILLVSQTSQDAETVIKERLRLFRLRLLRIVRGKRTITAHALDNFILSAKARVYQKVIHGLKIDSVAERYFEQQWGNMLAALQIAGVLSIPASRLSSAQSQPSATVGAAAAIPPPITVPPEVPLAPADEPALIGSATVQGLDNISDIENFVATERAGAGRSTEPAAELMTILDVTADEGESASARGVDAGESDDKPEESAAQLLSFPAAEHDVAIEPHSGLFAHARHLKYDAIIARRSSGIYEINDSMNSQARIDTELRRLVEAIS